MAFPQVDEQAVYACTGNPLPADIEACLGWLFNDGLAEAYNSEQRRLGAEGDWGAGSGLFRGRWRGVELTWSRWGGGGERVRSGVGGTEQG